MANFADNLGVEDFVDQNLVTLFLDQNAIFLGIGGVFSGGTLAVTDPRDTAAFDGFLSTVTISNVVLADRVLDLGLIILSTEANAFWLCVGEPTDYADANSRKRGVKTGVPFGAPEATLNGSSVVSVEITDGVGTVSGLCTHWAAVDTDNSRLLVRGALDESQSITVGTKFVVFGFTIEVLAHG